jgi:hypothetical protein
MGIPSLKAPMETYTARPLMVGPMAAARLQREIGRHFDYAIQLREHPR